MYENKKKKKSHEADWLREEFLTTSCPIKRNWVMKKLIAIWEPYVLSKITNFDTLAKDEILQIYRIRCLESIHSFKGKNGATFKSFLYYAAVSAVSRYLLGEKKTRLEYNFQGLDTYSTGVINMMVSRSIDFDTSYTKNTNAVYGSSINTDEIDCSGIYEDEGSYMDNFIDMGFDLTIKYEVNSQQI